MLCGEDGEPWIGQANFWRLGLVFDRKDYKIFTMLVQNGKGQMDAGAINQPPPPYPTTSTLEDQAPRGNRVCLGPSPPYASLLHHLPQLGLLAGCQCVPLIVQVSVDPT